MFGFRAAQLLHFRIVSQHVASQSTSMRLRTKMNNGLSRLCMGSATSCRQALGDPHVHIATSCCVGYSTPDPLRDHGTAV